MSTGQELYATDETFREVADLLFGGGADQLIRKMNPAQSDIAAEKERKKRGLTAALSGVGAAAGAGGLTLAATELAHGAKTHGGGFKGLKRGIKASKKSKVAAALLPLEVAGLGGEIAATKILHGDTKRKPGVARSAGPKPFRKDLGEISEMATTHPKKHATRAAITTAPRAAGKGLEYSQKAHGKLKKLPEHKGTHKMSKKMKTRTRAESIAANAAMGMAPGAAMGVTRHAGTKRHAAVLGFGAGVGGTVGAFRPLTHPEEAKPKKVKKSYEDVEVVWSGEFAKANLDKQQLFGWASVIEVNGDPVLDLQGDLITPDEMEKAGYEYVMKSRKGGDMHLRDNWSPIQKSEMIESFIVTDEKRQAMGLPDSVPTGWWVGFQVRDPEVWAKVRSGERTGFSIHGTGKRTPAG